MSSFSEDFSGDEGFVGENIGSNIIHAFREFWSNTAGNSGAGGGGGRRVS